jgi:hypothetical protein
MKKKKLITRILIGLSILQAGLTQFLFPKNAIIFVVPNKKPIVL